MGNTLPSLDVQIARLQLAFPSLRSEVSPEAEGKILMPRYEYFEREFPLEGDRHPFANRLGAILNRVVDDIRPFPKLMVKRMTCEYVRHARITDEILNPGVQVGPDLNAIDIPKGFFQGYGTSWHYEKEQYDCIDGWVGEHSYHVRNNVYTDLLTHHLAILWLLFPDWMSPYSGLRYVTRHDWFSGCIMSFDGYGTERYYALSWRGLTIAHPDGGCDD